MRAEVSSLPAVNLEDALRIALLVCDHEPERGERAAVRWLGRFCLERRDVTLAQVREILDAFAVLVEDPTELRRGWGVSSSRGGEPRTRRDRIEGKVGPPRGVGPPRKPPSPSAAFAFSNVGHAAPSSFGSTMRRRCGYTRSTAFSH